MRKLKLYIAPNLDGYIAKEPYIDKPIFVVGPPRSGTTLLYNILCAHPEVSFFTPESSKKWTSKEKIERLRTKFKKMNDNNESIPRNETYYLIYDTPKNISNKVYLPEGKYPIEGGSFWNQMLPPKFSESCPPDTQEKIKRVISEILQYENKPRFLNKYPRNSTRLYVLKKIFPDAKFISIFREPTSVIASNLVKHEKLGKWIVNKWPIKNQSTFKKLDMVGKYTWIYKEVIDNVLSFKKEFGEDIILTVMYHDLILHPKETVQKILSFSELQTNVDYEKMIPPIRETSSKWKERISLKDQKNIYNILSEDLKRINFSFKLN